jgi:hypothetical protein
MLQLLQRADEHANDRGEIILERVVGPLSWALWVNTSKNPRFKLLDLPLLRMTVELPKQIALANIAIRVQVRYTAELLTCLNSSVQTAHALKSLTDRQGAMGRPLAMGCTLRA